MSYTLHLGDCLELMPCIPAGSIDAIIADWPYGTTACKWDSVIPLEPLWKECKRVIKKNGAIVLTAAQPFTSVLVTSNLKWFKWEDVWHKTQAVGHLNAYIMPLREHESILIFGEGKIVYNPQFTDKPKEHIRPLTPRTKLSDAYGKHKLEQTRIISIDKSFPRSVIKCANVNRGEKLNHPTQKPVALMEYLIKTYTNPGDLVLDNTMGSGSTGEACLRTGRKFIGIEKDPGYFEIAKERLQRVEEELRQAQIARERQPYLMAEAQ